MVLFYLSVILLTGLLFGKLAKKFKLPNVTGYLLGGLLIGPILGLLGVHVIPESEFEELHVISQIALGFIAFSIGTEFQLSYFKRVGKLPIVIATLESFFAIVVVFVTLIAFGNDVRFSLVLSAIAAATAPAATIMVIKQYKAKGEVTENLLSVVAIDDATAIVFFGLFVAVAKAIGNASGDINLAWMISKPFVEIVMSLGIGGLAGVLISFGFKWFTGRGNRISLLLAFIFLVAAMPELIEQVLPDFEVSTLLACMMMGAVFTNLTKEDVLDTVMYLVDRVTPPIFIMFFVISGAELQFDVLLTVGGIGVIYIVGRVIGKLFGAFLGAEIAHGSHNVKKYLGWGLVPQAGVAIGLTIVAANIVPEYAAKISAIILSATFVYELVGPLITKTALTKAGEITPEMAQQKMSH
ncbi:cation:proton antiporter [Paracholeplasma manati]|uniref:Cation:proton antiporter n=1 Tax=Paracholeplasma manati TaxID=591373 RepID=A0ABT2Y8P0_9MOLU|nr:cation:proton antiporter [Paracholeplasma manati]MCV2232877.1 cation:proton antiporter [Paracholeplasma manati]MDG0889541.1 cation:proton antiporter [Paracholeplasma manati]